VSQLLSVADLRKHLPERIWYLSDGGPNLYCRRPYSFLFSSAEAAVVFARAFGVEELSVIGVDSKDIGSQEFVDAFRAMQITRLFLDPSVDPVSGDVFGTILRFQDAN
jgi:hypothetical protein